MEEDINLPGSLSLPLEVLLDLRRKIGKDGPYCARSACVLQFPPNFASPSTTNGNRIIAGDFLRLFQFSVTVHKPLLFSQQ